MRTRLIVLGLLLLATASVAAGQLGQTARERELVHALQARNINQALDVLNKVRQSPYTGDVLPFLQSLWDLDDKTLSEFQISKAIVEQPMLRINIADVIVQAVKNGQWNAPLVDIQSYARQIVTGRDKQAAASALLVLGRTDAPRDAKLIEGIALHDRSLFRPAVLSLAMMCNQNAPGALANIARQVSPQDRVFVTDTERRLRNFRDCDSHLSK